VVGGAAVTEIGLEAAQVTRTSGAVGRRNVGCSDGRRSVERAAGTSAGGAAATRGRLSGGRCGAGATAPELESGRTR
jgi:hypothetical protein